MSCTFYTPHPTHIFFEYLFRYLLYFLFPFNLDPKKMSRQDTQLLLNPCKHSAIIFIHEKLIKKIKRYNIHTMRKFFFQTDVGMVGKSLNSMEKVKWKKLF